MNTGIFVGRVAKAPVFRDGGKKPVCFVTLISNEFAGKDEATGDTRERTVAIPFTAFGATAAAISEHAFVGDQLIIQYRLANNDREENNQMEYGFSFIVDGFNFGAPGELKRAALAANQTNG